VESWKSLRRAVGNGIRTTPFAAIEKGVAEIIRHASAQNRTIAAVME